MGIPATDPIVAVPMVTAFTAGDQVDLDATQRNVERWSKSPLQGLIVGSQSGEEQFLSFEEQVSLVQAVRQSAHQQQFVVGGIDCPGITETLRRAEELAEAGADMMRIRFPRYPEVVEDYFVEVAARCPRPILLMHQSVPERFGAAGPPAAAPEVLGRVTQLDNIFGYVTDHDMRFEARVRRYVSAERRFWICNGSMILSGTLIGCNGTTTAFSNIWPEALQQLLELGMAGRYAEAQTLQEQVRQIDEIMLPFLATGIKAAMKLLGFEGMTPRSPTRPMPPAEVQRLQRAMQAAELV